MAANRQRSPLGDFKSHHIEAVAEGVLARLCSIALIAALVGGPDEKSRRSALELALGFGSDRFAHPARDALGHGTGHQRRRNDRDAIGKGGDENRILDPATVLLHRRTALEAQPELREALETGILGIAAEIGLLLERGLVSRHLFRRPLRLQLSGTIRPRRRQRRCRILSQRGRSKHQHHTDDAAHMSSSAASKAHVGSHSQARPVYNPHAPRLSSISVF
jgi:hypothetical protein